MDILVCTKLEFPTNFTKFSLFRILTLCSLLGRHWSNMTHIVLSGSIKYWREGSSEAKVYHKGESFTTRYWNTGGMQLKANTWMIEYGRGFLPLSIPSTIFDGIFTSFDLIGTFKMMRVFGMAYFYGIKNEIASFIKSI